MKITGHARRRARRLYRACLVDGRLDERRALQVADGLAGTGGHAGLAVLAEFGRLVRLDRERHRAVVESAVPLPPDLRAGVEAGVTRAYGPGVIISFAENPALIGGMRVRVGTDVWDGSVLAALRALEERL